MDSYLDCVLSIREQQQTLQLLVTEYFPQLSREFRMAFPFPRADCVPVGAGIASFRQKPGTSHSFSAVNSRWWARRNPWVRKLHGQDHSNAICKNFLDSGLEGCPLFPRWIISFKSKPEVTSKSTEKEMTCCVRFRRTLKARAKVNMCTLSLRPSGRFVLVCNDTDACP